jgi:hypothetical protein
MSVVETDQASIPVMLKGTRLIWLKDADGTGALAFPEHIDEEGCVKWEHVFSESFAHVCSDGAIRRFGAVIGNISDLAM